MKKYLVGGAVRDMIMGVEPKDNDWVIVGATEDDIQNMLNEGYEQVGADFPVFLHPKTKEEYALARVERKTGVGYQGFTCETENVTLEQDLQRRDLTMNAIAYDPETQQFIDPFDGRKDIMHQVIRHVSPAFAEDPVRVLRAARFSARFGFSIAEDTVKFMCQMKDQGELDHLVPERVMQELVKMAETAIEPSRFIQTLKLCNAWDLLFPEVSQIDQEQYDAIDKAVSNAAADERFSMFIAALLHKTPEERLQALQKRMVVPSKAFRFAHVVALHSATLATILQLQPDQIVTLFDNMSVTNRGGDFFLMRMSDMLFALGMMSRDLDEQILRLYDIYSSIDIQAEIERQKQEGIELKGLAIRDTLYKLRVHAVADYFE